MQDREDFRTLYTYHDWANDRLIAMLTQAFGAETDLRRAEDARVRAIQETTTHIVAAQTIWRTRWQGSSPTSMTDPADYPTPSALRRAFESERARFWAFFDSLESEADLARVVHYTNTQGKANAFPLRQLLQHAANHSTYHRGQVTARLLDLGLEAALLYTDLFLFYEETRVTADTRESS